MFIINSLMLKLHTLPSFKYMWLLGQMQDSCKHFTSPLLLFFKGFSVLTHCVVNAPYKFSS